MAGYASLKSQIRISDTEHVTHIAVVVIRLNYDVGGDPPLHSDMKGARKWRLETGIHRNRYQKDLGNGEIHCEIAETAPEKEPWLLAHSSAGGVHKLLISKAG